MPIVLGGAGRSSGAGPRGELRPPRWQRHGVTTWRRSCLASASSSERRQPRRSRGWPCSGTSRRTARSPPKLGPRCAGRRRAASPDGATRPGGDRRAFEAAAREGADALLPFSGPLANAHRARIIQLAARHRWPAMYYRRDFVDEGGDGLCGSLTDLWRRVAVYVDKILRGADPADFRSSSRSVSISPST